MLTHTIAAILLSMLVAALPAGAPATPAPGQTTAPHPPCATCIALTVMPEQVGWLPDALNGLDLLVAADPAAPGLAGLIDAIAQRGGHPGLLLRGLPTEADLPSLSSAQTIILDLRSSTLPIDRLVFELRTRLTELRAGAHGPLRLGVDPPPGLAGELRQQIAAGYSDIVLSEPRAGGGPGVWLRLGDLPDASSVLALTRTGQAERWLVPTPADGEQLRRMVADLTIAARLLTRGLVPGGDDVVVMCAGRRADVFLDPTSLDRVALLPGCGPSDPLTVAPALQAERLLLSSGDTIVRIAEPAADRFAADARVAAERRLTVDEIIARHQTAAARQAGALRTLISAGVLTVTFEAPGFPAPVTVSSETTIYREGGRTDLEQREIRVNGIAFRKRGVARLPIIEPERVAAPPLAITLGDKYRYRLVGEEALDGIRTYVVAFDPLSDREPLFRGRAWIAADDFGLARVSAAQTALRGAVVSSTETDAFTRIGPGTWVLARSDIRQLYQGAAYRTPIHRLLTLTTHRANSADFGRERRAAYDSEHTILRDTPDGYRYLEGADRRGAAADAESGAAPASSPAPPRGRSSRVRTLAFGVIVDPNITRPLPFAGLNYLDFDLFGTGAQLNAFFGGTYGQLAFSLPSIHGSRWQLAGQAFGIASSYNDRAFVGGREQYDRNLRQRPASASVSLLRPLSPRLVLRAGYELDYTQFGRSDATAPEFQAPADQVAHGLRVALEGQRAGWNATIWWSGSRRTGWRPWGRSDSGEYQPQQRDFQRYGASLVRSRIITPTLVVRGEASLMAGHDLDRFSRYAFGTFENRLRGYPAALIRYDRGTAIRTALAWSAGRFIRLDGFADAAFVRDTGFARGLSRFTGVGGAVEAPAPFGTLLAAEWGYGVEGVNGDGRRGTHVIRVTGYKVF